MVAADDDAVGVGGSIDFAVAGCCVGAVVVAPAAVAVTVDALGVVAGAVVVVVVAVLPVDVVEGLGGAGGEDIATVPGCNGLGAVAVVCMGVAIFGAGAGGMGMAAAGGVYAAGSALNCPGCGGTTGAATVGRGGTALGLLVYAG